MSGQQIGTVVGFVAGFFLPGGPSVWASIGGFVGGWIDPTKYKAPSIGDAQQQTSQTGMPIPKAFGHPPPFAPTCVDGDKVSRKVKKSQSNGKGAPSTTEYEGFVATRAFLIGEEIAAVARITRNGKLVYSTIAGDNIDADSLSFASQLRIYYGTRDQGPDPSLEAMHGVGNTPCYPGRSYFVVVDDDETDTRGAMNQYRIEVIGKGTTYTECGDHDGLLAWWPFDDATRDGVARELIANRVGAYSDTASIAVGPVLHPGGTPSLRMTTIYDFWKSGTGISSVLMNGKTAYTIQVWAMLENDGLSPTDGGSVVRNIASAWENITSGERGWGIDLWGTNNLQPEGFISGAGRSLSPSELPENSPTLFTITWKQGGVKKFYVGERLIATVSAGAITTYGNSIYVGGDPSYASSYGFIGCVADLQLYRREKTADEVARDALDGTSYVPLPDNPSVYVNRWTGEIVTGCVLRSTEDATQWHEIAEEISSRVSSRLSSHIDFSNMTDTVPGFLLGNASLKASDYLRTLCAFYFCDAVEYDGKIRTVRRGGAVVGTLETDDLMRVEDQDDDLWEQPIVGWRRLTVTYPDPANKYVASTQVAPRTSPDVSANSDMNIECPIPFDADTAAQKADILQKVKFCELEGTFTRAFPAEYDKYISSDPVFFNNRRQLITKKSFDLGLVKFQGRYDRASAYTSVVKGTAAPAPEPQSSNLKGSTELVAFNAPSLRTSDTVPGIYVAARGVLSGWPGCTLQISVDEQATWINATTINAPGTLGRLVNDVGTGSNREPITVELGPDGQVETITDAQIDAGLNRFAMVTDGIAEIGQFKTADLTSHDAYELTNITSGEFNTEEVVHFANDRFVLIDQAVLFIPIDSSYAGKTLYLRGVTLGTAEANNEVQSLVFDPPIFFHDGGTVTP